MRVGDDVLAAELEAALYLLEGIRKYKSQVPALDLEHAYAILIRVVSVLRSRLEALA